MSRTFRDSDTRYTPIPVAEAGVVGASGVVVAGGHHTGQHAHHHTVAVHRHKHQIDGDDVAAVPTVEPDGAHRFYGPDDQYDVQTHMPTDVDPTDKDFHYETNLVVAKSATFDELHESNSEKPVIRVLSEGAARRIFSPNTLNQIDRYIQPGSERNFALDKLYVVAARQLNAGRRNLPFPVGVKWVEVDGDGNYVKDFDAANTVRSVTGESFFVILQPDGNAPAADKLFDYHHVLESDVMHTYGSLSNDDLMGDIHLYPTNTALYMVPDQSELILTELIDLHSHEYEHLSDGHFLIPVEIVSDALKRRQVVDRTLNRTDGRRIGFMFKRADGNAAGDFECPVSKWNNTCYEGNTAAQEKVERAVYVPSFQVKIVFFYPDKADVPDVCAKVPADRVEDVQAFIAATQ